MTNRSLIIWSIALSLPAQYVFLLIPVLHEFFTVGITHSSGVGEFGCTNYHETGLSRCSLGDMLTNPILGIVLFNALSFGLFSVLFAGVCAVFLGVRRALYRKVSATSQ